MKLLKLCMVFLLLSALSINSVEFFKGYKSDKSQNYSILSLLKSKYLEDDAKWNENYFHEAQFPEQGITIFTNIIFSKAFIDKKGCKFNCIITFDDEANYSYDKDYSSEELTFSRKGFAISFDQNSIKLDGNNYILTINNEDINLSLNYKIINPPQIFGDGVIAIDSKNFIAFTEPIIGAHVSGNLAYKNKNIALQGRGSVGHDYNQVTPIKNPRKYRSFWLYNDNYSVNIHSIELTNKEQIDRISIYNNGTLLKSFLNTGLSIDDYTHDKTVNFKYPKKYTIDHKDKTGNEIKATINYRKATNRIEVFEKLSPAIRKLVTLAVGEMWIYRFWADATFSLKIDEKQENFTIKGIGSYLDTTKNN